MTEPSPKKRIWIPIILGIIAFCVFFVLPIWFAFYMLGSSFDQFCKPKTSPTIHAERGELLRTTQPFQLSQYKPKGLVYLEPIGDAAEYGRPHKRRYLDPGLPLVVENLITETDALCGETLYVQYALPNKRGLAMVELDDGINPVKAGYVQEAFYQQRIVALYDDTKTENVTFTLQFSPPYEYEEMGIKEPPYPPAMFKELMASLRYDLSRLGFAYEELQSESAHAKISLSLSRNAAIYLHDNRYRYDIKHMIPVATKLEKAAQ